MTTRHLTLALTSIALLSLAAPANAAKEKKGARGGRVLSQLDRDSSGAIEGREAKRAQAMYGALAVLDTDKNGQLSDSEIAAAKVPTGTAGEKKKRKKSK